MREVLFKAKRRDNNEWIVGYYCKYGDNHCIIKPTEFGIAKGVGIIPETLCEFTGLYDKNGKRIWENDIVFDTYGEQLGVVKFGMGTFDSGVYRYYGWHYESEGSVDHHELYKYDGLVDFEVLGNIFDNPELLTAERSK